MLISFLDFVLGAQLYLLNCHQKSNVTKNQISPTIQMSPKNKCYQNSKYQMSPKIKCHQKFNVTKNQMSPKI